MTVESAWPGGQPSPPPSQVLRELLFCVTLVRLGTRQAVCPQAVTTTDLPELVECYEEYLGVARRRGRTHRVTFGVADAHLPFLTSNEPLWAAFEPELRRRLGDLDAPAGTVERVRAALLEALPSGLASWTPSPGS